MRSARVTSLALVAITLLGSGALAACTAEQEAVGEGDQAMNTSEEGLDVAAGENKLPG